MTLASRLPTALILCLPCFVHGQSRPVVGAPPAELGLDSFYVKHVDAAGLPVVASDKVPDRALLAARDLSVRMLAKRDDVRDELVRRKVRIAVMAASEVTTDLPEHRDLNQVIPGTNWNERARGVGATVDRPASSCAEENLLGYPNDRYKGESIFIHEFAHTMLRCALRFVDQSLSQRLDAAHRDAMKKQLWQKTYAATNADEYWAEGVQSWSGANLEAKPANGIHNEVNTREELKKYDPALPALIAGVFADDAWRYVQPKSLAPSKPRSPATRPRKAP